MHLRAETFSMISHGISSMMKPVEVLHQIIRMMILDSYSLGGKSDSIIECKTLLRMMRHRAHPKGECMNGLCPYLLAHVHPSVEEEVSGLQVDTRDGQWIRLSVSQLLGLYCWRSSHGMEQWKIACREAQSQDEGRQRQVHIGSLCSSNNGDNDQTTKELVDESHPQLLNEFHFWEFIRFSYSKEGLAIDSPKQVFAYAGIK
ncbi:hypothetical protein P3X46_007274 [Hevea brasiliensis]|uniref:Uncharacterized protein n=1 Tax=Hevea brasiliensis TaxID=3981 RepID=A0ABQ9MV16_HEVBR|nr:hypothetical protein P3X46_007274 [Hevea brasiliensis]